MQSVQLNVADEVKALGDALKGLISDIKAKKSVAIIAADALPGFMAAIGGYASMSADIKLVDDQVYLVKCLAEAAEA